MLLFIYLFNVCNTNTQILMSVDDNSKQINKTKLTIFCSNLWKTV